MTRHDARQGVTRRPATAALGLGLAGLVMVLAGCVADGPLTGAVHYQCDNGVTAVVRRDGSVTVQAGRGPELLLRDAGGTTAQQVVYSNSQMRLETGLGADGHSARIEGMVPNTSARCSWQ